MSPDLYELIKSGYDPKLEPTGDPQIVAEMGVDCVHTLVHGRRANLCVYRFVDIGRYGVIRFLFRVLRLRADIRSFEELAVSAYRLSGPSAAMIDSSLEGLSLSGPARRSQRPPLPGVRVDMGDHLVWQLHCGCPFACHWQVSGAGLADR